MIIAGFDVGKRGAVCALDVPDMGAIEFLDCIDLPLRADGTQQQINVPALAAWIEKYAPDQAIVENVTPMPSIDGGNRSMGATSAFRFGMACGAIRATVEAYSVPMRLVTPQVWKRAVGLGKGSDKEASRQLAIKLLPLSKRFLMRKFDHNRAEACLLALYGANQRGLL